LESYKKIGNKNGLNPFYLWIDNGREKITEIDCPSLRRETLSNQFFLVTIIMLG